MQESNNKTANGATFNETWEIPFYMEESNNKTANGATFYVIKENVNRWLLIPKYATRQGEEDENPDHNQDKTHNSHNG